MEVAQSEEETVSLTLFTALSFPPDREKSHSERGCFHVEYELLPRDTVRLDLLLFGPVAKIYKEDQSKVLQTWSEAGQTWLGWTQDLSVNLCRDKTIQILQHQSTVHIWNQRDQLGLQARSDRMGRARVMMEDMETCDGVKSMVSEMRRLSPKDRSTATCDSEGPASLHFSPIRLLAGERTLSHWASLRCCGVIDFVIHVSLHKPLLSDALETDLNPMVLTVLSASSMPPAPVQDQCLPVHCQYSFLNLPKHKTNYEKHGAKIHFNDMNVILTGLLNPQDLHEFLSGPPMQIEVHDRDRKPARCGLGGQTRKKKEPFDSYGVAGLSLSELLLGATDLKVCLPIRGCRPDLDPSVPPGPYVDANSQLRVRVKLARPLQLCSHGAEFGRVVCVFGCDDVEGMEKLRLQILKSNRDAFDLDQNDTESSENALSNLATRFQHSLGSQTGLDFISGFHVVDTKTHIVVVEGLRREAVKRLLETVFKERRRSKQQVVCDPGLSFSKRLYPRLDLSLRPVLLPQTLDSIMKQPLVFVRGIVPSSCLQGLLRLSQLREVRTLRDAVKLDLFPSEEMVQSLRTLYQRQQQQQQQQQEP
ncbi:unnamed protein product [Knipowitschia caucasica]